MTAGMIAVPVIIPLKPPTSLNKGRRKWMIDSNTPIEIHCSTDECLLFYTLDGTKPDPFKKIGDKTTYQYQKAFTLKPGKRTVKAIAVLRNGLKESSVNTKVFHVESAPQVVVPKPPSDDEDDIGKTSWTHQRHSSEDEDEDNEVDQEEKKMFKKVIRSSLHHNEKKPPEEMISRIVTAFEPEVTEKEIQLSPKPRTMSPPYSHPVASNKNFPDEMLRCMRCGAPRPRDPYARFCNGCQSVLPPAPGYVRASYRDSELDYEPCKNCGSIVSSDLVKCGICNEVIRKPKSTIQNSRIKCEQCSSLNPARTTECLVCDAKLSNIERKKSVTPPPETESQEFLKCVKCFRINCGDARFCDWCGEKCANKESRAVACSNCSTENALFSHYCSNCGNKLQSPLRNSFQKTLGLMIQEGDDSTMKLLSTLTLDEKSSPPSQVNGIRSPISPRRRSPTPPRRRFTKDVYVQAGESHIKDAFVSNEPVLAKQTPIIKPSPGKGYWRQQIEHVTQQMKIYAQNNVEFRESFSQYILLGLQSVNYVADDEVLTLTTQFQMKPKKTKKTHTTNTATRTTRNESGETLIQAILASRNNAPVNSKLKNGSGSGVSSKLSSANTTRPNSARSVNSSRPSSARSTSSNRSTSSRKKKRSSSQKKLEKEKIARKLSKLSPENLEVLKIVKSKKLPDIDDFKDLLTSANFDVNALDENDTPLLKLCVQNNKAELIAPLLKVGADVNKITGAKENTALHESVLLGYNGKDCLDALLQHKKINFDIKDKKGRTAYDLALEGGFDVIINKFTNVMSRNLLNDIVKI